jgi:uncharacterized membrane protein (DUF485 family)
MGIKQKLIQVMSLNVVLWLLMLLVFSGLLLCAAGVYMLLAARMTPVQAMLITGGALIVIGAILMLLVGLATSSSDKTSKKKVKSEGTVQHTPDNLLEGQLRPMLGDQATDWAKHHSGLTAATALTAGVIIAASPRVRAAMMGAIGPLFTRKVMQAVQQQFTDHR